MQLQEKFCSLKYPIGFKKFLAYFWHLQKIYRSYSLLCKNQNPATPSVYSFSSTYKIEHNSLFGCKLFFLLLKSTKRISIVEVDIFGEVVSKTYEQRYVSTEITFLCIREEVLCVWIWRKFEAKKYAIYRIKHFYTSSIRSLHLWSEDIEQNVFR